jgi:hypothetical protein
LNWTIGLYLALRFFFPEFAKTSPLQSAVETVPFLLLLWQGMIIAGRIRDRVSVAPLYRRLESSDYWRAWLILMAVQGVAYKDKSIFYFFTAIAGITLVFLLAVTIREFYQNRRITPLVVGCLAFAFLLLRSEKGLYVTYHGVPKIGHYFEKTRYDARYPVEISSQNTKYFRESEACFKKHYKAFSDVDSNKNHMKEYVDCTMQIVMNEDKDTTVKTYADIHVSNWTEDDGYEDDDGTYISSQVAYRDIWVEKIYLPDGKSLTVADQGEPLKVNEYGQVEDENGQIWGIRVLN